MYKIGIKFKKNIDATPAKKDQITSNLPPRYKIGRKEMEGMESGKEVIIGIKEETTAKKIASDILTNIPNTYVRLFVED
jgi:hypothetical protein